MRFLAVAAALAASLALPERRPGQPGPADPRPGGTGYRVAGTDAAVCFGTREQRRGDAGDDGHQPRLGRRRHRHAADAARRAGRHGRRLRDSRRQCRRPEDTTARQTARRRAAPPPPALFGPDFTGLCPALLQLLVEREWKSARARRREGRNDVAGENLIARGRYRVVPSPQSADVFASISRINNWPSKNFSNFKLAAFSVGPRLLIDP